MCTKELIELGLWLSSDDESRVELERQRLSLQSSIQQQENRVCSSPFNPFPIAMLVGGLSLMSRLLCFCMSVRAVYA